MKKSCFIKLIVVLTVVVAAITYIVQNKMDDFILKPGKEFIKGQAIKQIYETLDDVIDNPEKDSLKQIINIHFADMTFDEIKKDKFSRAIELIENAAEDSLITSEELNQIHSILSKIRKDEEPKKD